MSPEATSEIVTGTVVLTGSTNKKQSRREAGSTSLSQIFTFCDGVIWIIWF